MTKAQRRMLRQIIGHCKYCSTAYYLVIADRRRWKTALALYDMGLIDFVPDEKYLKAKPVVKG